MGVIVCSGKTYNSCLNPKNWITGHCYFFDWSRYTILKCLRISSSPRFLRISPLTLRYVFPRQPPLIPCTRSSNPKAGRLRSQIIQMDCKNRQKDRPHWSMLCHSMLCHSVANDCLEHAVLFTVITTGGQTCVACVICWTPRPTASATPVKEWKTFSARLRSRLWQSRDVKGRRSDKNSQEIFKFFFEPY